MAKSKSFLIYILWLLGTLCAFSQDPVRQRLVDSALSQVGVRELTGHNDGRDVEKYLRVTGLGKGYAWCAAFLSWDYQVNHVPAVKTAWAPNWFPAKTVIYKSGLSIQEPRPGDVFGLWIGGRIGHVGMIYRWDDKTITTIEGNTNQAGSREGDGVYIKKRLRRQIYIVSTWSK